VELRETSSGKRNAGFTSRKSAINSPRGVSLRETTGSKRNSGNPSRKQVDASHEAFFKKLAARFVAIFIFFALFLLILFSARAAGLFNPDKITVLVEQAGVWGPLVLIGVLIVTSMSLAIPSSPVIILAGALFGARLATVYSLIGIMIGASIAFWIARLFREPIIKMLGEHATVLVRFQRKYVMIALFVTRAIPVFSFEVMSYASGLTSISYGEYLLATLGALSSIVIFATLGSLGASVAFADGGGTFSVVLALLLTLVLFVVPLAIDHYNPFGWKEKLLHPERAAKKQRTK
jgi:uncharacterized membrane protein YdjX (TVP38/TMEM64 family)